MKVFFKNNIMAYSGKCDGLVYYYNSKLGRMMTRKWVTPKTSSQNILFSQISANLKALNLSESYKQDLRDYTIRYSTLKEFQTKPCLNWHSVFTKIMWAMKDALGLDLTTITREQIETDNLPCRTVKQAVEAGYIPVVRNYERLDNTM
jgi:hypothetical protein